MPDVENLDPARWVMAAAALVLLLGASVLVFGGLGDIAAPGPLLPSLAGMPMSTAAGLVICGFCLLLERPIALRRARQVRIALASLALLLALADLAMLAAGSPGLDERLLDFSDARGEIHMSPATSICLVLATVCLLLSHRRDDALSRHLYSGLAGAGLFIAAVSLTGHVFDSEALQSVFVFGSMGLNTTAGFLLLFPALLLSRPGWGFMSVFTGPGLGSSMLRRLLPIAVFGPIVLCWLSLLAVESGLFKANFRLSILAIVMSVTLVAALCWAALRENAAAAGLIETNERLRLALSDRDILLKEVYHRVKNNLQFVDAMLALEGREADADGAAQRLADVRVRLHALALVHQQLVNSRDLASLDIGAFLGELCDNLAKGAGLDARGIAVTVDADPIRLHLDRAIPIGLVVTELVSNAVKYAFPHGGKGEILVLVQDIGNAGLRLRVSDNGIGRSAENDNPKSVGSMIIRSLAGQLDAEMNEHSDAGCTVELLIPPETDRED